VFETELRDVPTIPRLVAAAAEYFGDAPFLVTDGRAQSFREVSDAVSRIAGALARRGVAPGDRVVVMAANGPNFVHAWLAAIHLGALPAPVNPAVTARETAALVRDLAPTLILADADAAPIAREAVGNNVPVERLEELENDADAVPAARARPGDAAALVFTSGTTSRPKGAVVTHAAYVLSGESFPSWVGVGKSDRLWVCLPLFHMNAQAYSLMTAMAHGLPLVLSARFSASRFWEDAADLGVTVTNVVGAMLELLRRQPVTAFQPSGLRLIYAAPAPAARERNTLERRFGIRIVTGYGMTELPFGTIESRTSREKPGSIGRPRTHPWRPIRNEVRVVSRGAEAPLGEAGELEFRNATVSPGYWNSNSADARVDADGWLRTGDLGCIDNDGDIRLIGRVKEMIRRRGENIAPLEIEEVLMAHPSVLVAAAFGIPSALTEEDVAAAVVPRPGQEVTSDALRLWCAERLAAFKVPDVILVRDALPMTPSMRVAKNQLAAIVASERAS
jgi:carnitine-CoA ligase